jgi:uncharacterized membrane protein YdfJ with MMPL/SSD domain
MTLGQATDEHLFARIGRFSARRRRPLMIIWLVVILAAAPLAITVSRALSGAGAQSARSGEDASFARGA